MKIKANLPSKISLTSKSIVIAATHILASETGREIRPNLRGFGNVRDYGCVIGIDIASEGPNSICFWGTQPDSSFPTCSTIEEFFSLIEDKPIKIGDYEVTSIDGSGVKVGYTFVPWETIELLLSKKPKASEYRILDDDEKGYRFRDYPILNEIEREVDENWYPGYRGDLISALYRTKLSREALASLREERK